MFQKHLHVTLKDSRIDNSKHLSWFAHEGNLVQRDRSRESQHKVLSAGPFENCRGGGLFLSGNSSLAFISLLLLFFSIPALKKDRGTPPAQRAQSTPAHWKGGSCMGSRWPGMMQVSTGLWASVTLRESEESLFCCQWPGHLYFWSTPTSSQAFRGL